MNPRFFPLPKADNETVVFQQEELNWFYDTLHFHNAFQITHFLKGSGTCFVADRIHSFEAGDIFVIGSNVPHVFRSHPHYYASLSKECLSQSLFFNRGLFIDQLSRLPEAGDLLAAMRQLQSGIKLRNDKLARKIADFELLNGFRRIISLLELVLEISLNEGNQQLSEHPIPDIPKEIAYERINKVIEHAMTHYTEKVTLEEVASLVSMTPNAFCKYFKQRTRQTFIDFLNKVRVEQAARLLQKTELSVADIAIQTGFNNLTNFNRQFSRRKGKSPGQFRSGWLKQGRKTAF